MHVTLLFLTCLIFPIRATIVFPGQTRGTSLTTSTTVGPKFDEGETDEFSVTMKQSEEKDHWEFDVTKYIKCKFFSSPSENARELMCNDRRCSLKPNNNWQCAAELACTINEQTLKADCSLIKKRRSVIQVPYNCPPGYKYDERLKMCRWIWV